MGNVSLGIVDPPARWLGLLPRLSVFRATTFEAELAGAGFFVEHRWRPAPDKALFVIARKPA